MTAQDASAPIATVGDVVATLDAAYPPHLAESWDSPGLTCGDPASVVRRVAFALDATEAAVDAALEAKADLLVTHHPLLMKGATSVGANTPKGALIHRLISGGCALYSAHTNADCARPGLNDHLAELLGVTPGRPIVVSEQAPLDRWVVTVPVDDADAVRDAAFAAGAGAVGNYRDCSFAVEGEGRFLPTDGARPAVGQQGVPEKVDELRLEFIAPRRARDTVGEAIRAAHPYETPAVDILHNHAPSLDVATAPGLGRVGELDEPMTLADFTRRVADRLPSTAWGIRAAGDPTRIVRRVAVCGGAGDSLLDTVRGLDVDVYVTSDLRHHPVDEALRAGLPAVIDTAHWASESPWLDQAAGVVAAAVPTVETRILPVRTDPWTLGIPQDDTQ